MTPEEEFVSPEKAASEPRKDERDVVFVSHSSLDLEGIDFFNAFFNSIGVKGFNYEFEGPKPPHSSTIFERIRASRSIFVLMSPKMKNSYTSAWVGYEVGVGLKSNKYIWVYENPDSRGTTPVPNVTAYVERRRRPQGHAYPFDQIIRLAGMQPPSKIIPKNGRFLEGFECPNTNCRERYHIFLINNYFKCPSCRRMIDYDKNELVSKDREKKIIQRPFVSRLKEDERNNIMKDSEVK